MKKILFFSVLPLLLAAFCADAEQIELNPDHLISIDIESTRSQLVAGEGLGVVAKIKNISGVTIYIKESSFSLTIPLEMEGKRGFVSGYYAFFPTEPHKGQRYEEYYSNILKLNPGDTYSAFWTNTFLEETELQEIYILKQIVNQFQFIFFYPGRYSIAITAKYWTDQSLPADKYRTITKDITIQVVPPLFVILFGAALGGLVAHFILPQKIYPSLDGMPIYNKAIKGVMGIIGSTLLSVIVTIFLSRVSENQFMISVTVNDFWGAIVTGFVSNYAGYSILEKLLPAGNISENHRVIKKEHCRDKDEPDYEGKMLKKEENKEKLIE